MMVATNVIHTNIKSFLLLFFVLLLATSSLTFGDIQHDVDHAAAAAAAADSSLNSVVHGSLRLLKPKTGKASKSNRARSSKNSKTSKMSKSGGKSAGKPEITLLRGQDNAFIFQDKPVHINFDWFFSADENTAETAPTSIFFKVNGLTVDTNPWVDGNYSGRKSIILDRVGDFDLSVSVCNLEKCLHSDSIRVTISDETNSFLVADSTDSFTFVEAEAWVLEFRENNDDIDDDTVNLLVDPITTTIAAKFFGKIALTKLGGLGMDKLFESLGWVDGNDDKTAEKFRAISDSLTKVEAELELIKKAITLNFAESKFTIAHGLTITSMKAIESITDFITGAAQQNEKQTAFVLNGWAETNAEALKSLGGLMTDPVAGALPSMLELLAIKYPVSDFLFIRKQIVSYVDGVRATIGLAAMNQAWLIGQYSSLATYNYIVEKNALAAGIEMYNIIGATFSVSADRKNPFLHRIGEELALVGADRFLWNVGANIQEAPEEEVVVEHGGPSYDHTRLIKSLDAGNVDLWNGVTKQDWLNQNGFLLFSPVNNNKNFESTFFIRKVINVSQGDYSSVRVYDVGINGNTFNVKRSYDIFSDKCEGSNCANAREIMRHFGRLAEAQRVKPENKLYYIDNISKKMDTMNGYGMPALMDPEYIAQERDGIVVRSRKQEITSSGVQEITLTVVDLYGSKADGAYRAINPDTGEVVSCYFNRVSNIINADSHTGQVILQAGYKITLPNGQQNLFPCDMVVRQSALVDDLEDGNVKITIKNE